MPVVKRILCLANSKKMSGRCVAGREVLDTAPRGSTLNPDFRAFSESDSSSGAGFKAMIAKVLWWHVCNSHRQT